MSSALERAWAPERPWHLHTRVLRSARAPPQGLARTKGGWLTPMRVDAQDGHDVLGSKARTCEPRPARPRVHSEDAGNARLPTLRASPASAPERQAHS